MEAQEAKRLRRLAAAITAAQFDPAVWAQRAPAEMIPEPFGTFVDSGEYDKTRKLLDVTGEEILVVAGRALSEACDLVLFGAGWTIIGEAYGKPISRSASHEEVLHIIARCIWSADEALEHIRKAVDRIVERTLAA